MLLVGNINGIFGIQGWVKVFSHTEQKANICQYIPWHIFDKNTKTYSILPVLSTKPHSKTIIAQIENINNPQQAQLLIGQKLYIKPEQLPKLDLEEYYWKDLIGMRVINLSKVDLGVVKSLFNAGANDILLVKKQNTQQLIPYSPNHIINISDQTITVDWQEYY